MNFKETVKNLNIFKGNLHKWAFVSRACAILCVNPKHQSQIEPLVTSWNYAKRKAGDWQAPFFTLGTHDHSSQFSVLEAIKFYNEVGGLVCYWWLKTSLGLPHDKIWARNILPSKFGGQVLIWPLILLILIVNKILQNILGPRPPNFGGPHDIDQ